MYTLIVVLIVATILCVVATTAIIMSVIKSGINIQVTVQQPEQAPANIDIEQLRQLFEVANETDPEEDPEFKAVMDYLNEEFGGVDYGDEAAEE